MSYEEMQEDEQSEELARDVVTSKIKNREWRLDSLYSVVQEDATVVRFKRREPQLAFWKNIWYCNTILKARRIGFSTQIGLILLDTCLFNSNINAGIIDINMDDASKKLDRIKFSYDRLPKILRDANPIKKANESELILANGSNIQVGTSHRGSGLQLLHVSEFGKISAQFPEKAREIKTGAFNAVTSGQFIFVESTAEGQGGEFYEMVEAARKAQLEGIKLTPMDFRFHFVAWWRFSAHRLDPLGIPVTPAMNEYFLELKVKHGIDLDAAQKAWYIVKHRQMGPDDMLREFPSIPEEAFYASNEGAYFKQQMTKARQEKRIGQMPHDQNKKVNTWWDIGNDTTAIWFHQTDGVRHRLIDYYENSGEQIGFYARVLKEKAAQRGFIYGKHLGPHDLAVRDWGGEGRNRIQRAEELGFPFDLIPKVDSDDDAINETRGFLELCWFDAVHCKRGIQCLDNFRKEWDEKRGTWRSQYYHNWASHGSKALMSGVMGYVDEPIPASAGRHRRRPDPPRSAWGV
jgi:hypothetical protein